MSVPWSPVESIDGVTTPTNVRLITPTLMVTKRASKRERDNGGEDTTRTATKAEKRAALAVSFGFGKAVPIHKLVEFADAMSEHEEFGTLMAAVAAEQVATSPTDAGAIAL